MDILDAPKLGPRLGPLVQPPAVPLSPLNAFRQRQHDRARSTPPSSPPPLTERGRPPPKLTEVDHPLSPVFSGASPRDGGAVLSKESAELVAEWRRYRGKLDGFATSLSSEYSFESIEYLRSRHEHFLNCLSAMYSGLEAKLEILQDENLRLRGLQTAHLDPDDVQTTMDPPLSGRQHGEQQKWQPRQEHGMLCTDQRRNGGVMDSQGRELEQAKSNARTATGMVRSSDHHEQIGVLETLDTIVEQQHQERLEATSQGSLLSQRSGLASNAVAYDAWKELAQKDPTERIDRSSRLADSEVYLRQQRALGGGLGRPGSRSVTAEVGWIWMIHPQAPARILWDILGAMLLWKDLVTIPLQVFGIHDTDLFWDMDHSSLTFWTMDILVSLSTGVYIDQGEMSMNRYVIFSRYIRTWGPIDVPLVVLDWMTMFMGSAGPKPLVRSMRVLKLLKLVRLLRFERFLVLLELRTNSNRMRLLFGMIKQGMAVLVACHFLCCMWYGLGTGLWFVGTPDKEGKDGWVYAAGLVPEQNVTYAYLTSAHWAVANFIGTMEVVPTTSAERLFSVCLAFVALFATSWLVGNITQTMFDLQALHKSRNEEQKQMCQFLRERGISINLTTRVKLNLDGEWQRREGALRPEADVHVLARIPDSLLSDIREEARAPILCRNDLFRRIYLYYPRVIREICRDAMEEIAHRKGDRVFSIGDACTRVFLLTHGDATYWVSQISTVSVGTDSRAAMSSVANITRQEVGPGVRLCEASLWTRWKHQGRLTINSKSLFLTLSPEKLLMIIRKSPSVASQAAKFALNFVDQMNLEINPNDLFCLPSYLPELSVISHLMGDATAWDAAEDEMYPQKNSAIQVNWSQPHLCKLAWNVLVLFFGLEKNSNGSAGRKQG